MKLGTRLGPYEIVAPVGAQWELRGALAHEERMPPELVRKAT